MDDLVAFLRARLDEDEQIARDATGGPWVDEFSAVTGHCVLPPDALDAREYVAKTQLLAALPDARHIARHDPARVLREVEAKRQLLDRHKPGRYGECVTCDVGAQSCGCCGWGDFPCDTVRLLALPYAAHGDYREAWKP